MEEFLSELHLLLQKHDATIQLAWTGGMEIVVGSGRDEEVKSEIYSLGWGEI